MNGEQIGEGIGETFNDFLTNSFAIYFDSILIF